jgi:uncharacterized protein YbjT (DUF2867 family)
MTIEKQRVLITGGGTFLGVNIATALLAEGAEVTLLVHPDREHNLGPLAQRTRWQTADVWDSASLRGRARGHNVVINTVGSMVADPARGLTYHRLNFVSARNVAAMCVSDGVPHMILMSSVNTFWLNNQYIRAKREAENYLERVGIHGTIIRAPLAYVRGQKRPVFYSLTTLLGSLPPLSLTRLGRIAPMPADILARGVARIALETERTKRIYYARDLRRRNKKEELSRPLSVATQATENTTQQQRTQHHFEVFDEESPFGWIPPKD